MDSAKTTHLEQFLQNLENTRTRINHIIKLSADEDSFDIFTIVYELELVRADTEKMLQALRSISRKALDQLVREG